MFKYTQKINYNSPKLCHTNHQITNQIGIQKRISEGYLEPDFDVNRTLDIPRLESLQTQFKALEIRGFGDVPNLPKFGGDAA